MPSFIRFARQTRNCARYNRIIISHRWAVTGPILLTGALISAHVQIAIEEVALLFVIFALIFYLFAAQPASEARVQLKALRPADCAVLSCCRIMKS